MSNIFTKPLFSVGTVSPGFGMELSASAIKIVQLNHRGKNLVVEIVAAADLPVGTVSDGEILNPQVIRQVASKLIDQYGSKLGNGVVSSLPESKTFFQILSVPKEAGTALDAAVVKVIPEYLPLTIDEMYFDTALLSETANQWRVAVGAAPKKMVEAYLTLFEDLKLIPLALDLEATAISRALIVEKESTATAILDLGTTHASLIVSDKGIVQFTISMPITGLGVTERIAKTLDLTSDQAEKAKRTCGLHPDRCEGVVLTILEETVASLARHIIDAEDYYENRFPEASPISTIIVCGGGAALPNLAPALTQAIGKTIILANPWDALKLPAGLTIDNPLGFTTTVGLARKALISL